MDSGKQGMGAGRIKSEREGQRERVKGERIGIGEHLEVMLKHREVKTSWNL